ncbi:MAG: DUF1326 domain-containing protein [Bryobacteraceae bacterium]
MNKLLVLLLAGTLAAFAGAVPSTTIQGNYIETRTADVFTGPCFANAEAGLIGELAVFGWKINQGSWQGVRLDGLAVAGAVRASSTLGDVYKSAYPVKSILIIDERATPEQRLALGSFARKIGGDLLQDVVKVEYAPIELKFADNDMHSMKATFSAGTLATIETRAISENDHLCRNEEVWYSPLAKTTHAMPAVATAHTFRGEGLGTTWSSPDKRSSFLGNFVFPSE